MSTQPLYCHSCKEYYNVRKEDIELMQKHDENFKDLSKGYEGGCFSKNLGVIKRLLNKLNEQRLIMIVDVNVSECDDAFVENIEDIIEDTMVQMFVLHPKDEASLKKVKELAGEHNTVYYTTPTKLLDSTDSKCVGVYISEKSELKSIDTHVVIVNESNLDDTFNKALEPYKGIILNATKPYDELENFFISIGPGFVDEFDKDVLKHIPMEKMVLQSNYPKHDFDDIYTSMEKVSEVILRAEMSIAAEATKNAMKLFGWSQKR